VTLDRGGGVLGDVAGQELSVRVATGAHRLVLAGLGGRETAPAGLAGWHGATLVAQVSADTYLAPGAVIRAEAARTVRGRRTVASALLRAGDAVAGSGSVSTRFAVAPSSVLLALDADGAVDAALDGLVLGVDGARRVGEPLVVVAGDRTYSVFALEAPAASKVPVTIAVGSDERWLLAGVVGSGGSAADLAQRVEAGGVSDVVAELVAASGGLSEVSWSG
jgi:hypothetical protein